MRVCKHVCVSSRGSQLSHGKVEKDKHEEDKSVAGIAHFAPHKASKPGLDPLSCQCAFVWMCVCLCVHAGFMPVHSILSILLCNNPAITFH